MNQIRVVILLSRWGYGSPNEVRRLVAEGRVSHQGRALCDGRALVPHSGAGITVDDAPAERQKTRDDDLRAVEKMVADGLLDQAIVKACFARGCSKKQTGRLISEVRGAGARVAPGGLGTLPSGRRPRGTDTHSGSSRGPEPGGRHGCAGARLPVRERRGPPSSHEDGSWLSDDQEADEVLAYYEEEFDESDEDQHPRPPQAPGTEARHRDAVATMLANGMNDAAVVSACHSFGCAERYTRQLIEAVRGGTARSPAERAPTAKPRSVDPWEDL